MKKLTMTTLLETIRECISPVGAAYLSKHLDASAATIGRMLKQAENKGFITSVSNKGRIITPKGEAYLESRMTQEEILQNAEEVVALAFSEDPKHAKDILEFRKLIEPYAVSLAAVNATDEDLDEIRDLDFEHRYVVKKGESGSEQDLKMHLKFAELSGNSALYQVLRLILIENNVYQYFSSITTMGKAGSYPDHEAILKGIYDRDAQAASAAMEKHLDNLINIVSENLR
ncbi:MAG: FCD domain-containing protein [Emergencia sp.]